MKLPKHHKYLKQFKPTFSGMLMETQILAIVLLNHVWLCCFPVYRGADGDGRYIILCSARALFGVSLTAAVVPLAFCHLASESDCISFFGSSKAAFKLTKEGLVHGVEHIHCKKLHSATGLSSTKSLWVLVSNQKAGKKH